MLTSRHVVKYCFSVLAKSSPFSVHADMVALF